MSLGIFVFAFEHDTELLVENVVSAISALVRDEPIHQEVVKVLVECVRELEFPAVGLRDLLPAVLIRGLIHNFDALC